MIDRKKVDEIKILINSFFQTEASRFVCDAIDDSFSGEYENMNKARDMFCAFMETIIHVYGIRHLQEVIEKETIFTDSYYEFFITWIKRIH